jgi:transposase
MVKSSMNGIDSEDAADGPVVSAGGRSPSALTTGQGDMGTGTARLGPLAPGQRWSVARKREVVLRLLHGASAELLSRELGVPIYKLEQWRRKADAALEGALKGPGHCPGPRPSSRRRANSPRPCSGSAS